MVVVEERFHGWAAAQLEDFKDNVVKPLFKKMAELEFEDTDVSEFLHAEHTKERNEAIANISPSLKDGGRS